MNSCLICGCAKNCELYLDSVFKNIKSIQSLFEKTKIIISFDNSSDFTLKKLCELKKEFDIEIIINKDSLSTIRTVNIENARNKILNQIYESYNEYDYFIMIDMDDVSSKPINIDVLKGVGTIIGTGLEPHQQFDGPTLFLRGLQSGYITDEARLTLHHHFPNNILKGIEKAGHWLHAENPTAFLEAIESWWE